MLVLGEETVRGGSQKGTTMSHKTISKLKYNVFPVMVSYLIMTKIKLYKYFTKYLLKPYKY